MKIQYCSDLHLEFDHNSKYIEKNPLKVIGDILIMAGDIIPLHDEYFTHPFLKFVADNFEKVFWVPGNHEYYHKDLREFSNSFQIDIKSNLSIVSNISTNYENTNFIFSTLWTEISESNKELIEYGVSDFSCITKKDRKITANDYNNLHTSNLEFIKKTLLNTSEKTVVVTHHLPSALCNSVNHLKSPINEAFCVDLTQYIETCKANFWIYGHSHFNQKPLFIGNTVMLTNQLGYVHLNEHSTYKLNAYFSI